MPPFRIELVFVAGQAVLGMHSIYQITVTPIEQRSATPLSYWILPCISGIFNPAYGLLIGGWAIPLSIHKIFLG